MKRLALMFAVLLVTDTKAMELRLASIFSGHAGPGVCRYSMVGLSKEHAKTEAIREEFGHLHPFLKLGAGIVLLVDRDLLITDVTRKREDYATMGLPTLRQSLHDPQADGYVHAIDLRTRHRAEIRNWLLEKYFELMGFHTLRHGTTDHLHVSIPVRVA